MKLMVQCCVCSRIRRGDQWVERDASSPSADNVSHGYCPACAAKAFAEVAAHVANTDEKKDSSRIRPASAA